MSEPGPALQAAAAAALLADAAVVALVDVTSDGPAVFAPHQALPEARRQWITVDAPQVLPTPDDGVCGQGSLVYLTVHCWAQGPAATLEAGELAGQVRRVLSVRLPLTGRRVSAFGFESASPGGDPEPTIEHVVCTFRYVVRPTA